MKTGAMKQTGRNEERHPIEVWGQYRTVSGVRRDVILKDLSATGCRFYDRFSGLTANTTIQLRIDQLGPFPAAVRWNEAGYIGVEFDRPLYGPVFDHIRLRLGHQS